MQGHAPAQYDLASLYYEGRGVPVDEEKAALWLGKAAKAGIPAAQLEYARLLVKGQGVPKPSDQGKAPDVLKQEREAEAFGLIRAAALKGNVVAQNRLARFYFFGVVVEGDLVEGAKWHLIARQAGVADLAMDNLLGKMAKDQRAKAEKAAADWLVRAATE